MHVIRASLSNVRSFPLIEITLPSHGWIVFAGRNGAGKTTLLQSIAAGVLGPANLSWLIEDASAWIHLQADDASVRLLLDGAGNERDAPDAPGGPFEVEARWSRRLAPPAPPAPPFVHQQLQDGAGLGMPPHGWMLAGYGATRFNEPSSAAAERLMKAPPRRSAVVTLFRRDASLQVTDAWIGEVVTSHLLPDPHADTSPTFRANRFQLLKALLEDDLLAEPDGPANRVALMPTGLGLHRPEGVVPIAAAGQGLESLALLVADLVRQMSRFYGEAFLDGSEWTPTLGVPITVPHPGVVLLDEAENHLHPRLQQHIGFWLKSRFPAVQFLVTTHSPFVCQAADPGGLFCVSDGAVRPVDTETFRSVVYGSNEEAVLTGLFGLHSPWSPASTNHRMELARLHAAALDSGTASHPDAARMQALAALLPGDASAQTERVLRLVRVGS